MSKSLLTVAASLVCALALQGCALVVLDRRDTPWDPQGRPLFEQLPHHINKAHNECCSVLMPAEFLRMRCDTDRPVEPRTNRC